MAPSFLAAGFIRDAEADQSVTRGYLWLAASWPAATDALLAVRILKAILVAAIPAGSFWTQGTMAAGKVRQHNGPLVASSNESDVELESAANESVVGLVQAASGLAAIVTTALGNRGVLSSAASALRNETANTANKMRLSISAVGTARAIVARVPAECAAALALPAEAQAAAGVGLAEMRRVLESSKASILSGMQDARPTLEMCAQEQSDGSSIAKRIRDAVHESARASIDKRSVPTIAREYAKCVLWRRAQLQLDAELRGLSAEIQESCLIASGLVNGSAELAMLVVAIDAGAAVAGPLLALSALTTRHPDNRGTNPPINTIPLRRVMPDIVGCSAPAYPGVGEPAP